MNSWKTVRDCVIVMRYITFALRFNPWDTTAFRETNHYIRALCRIASLWYL